MASRLAQRVAPATAPRSAPFADVFMLAQRFEAELTAAQIDYLATQRLGRLAPAGRDGKPHVVPTSFRSNNERGTVDIGGFHVATTKKYRDVQAKPWAALVVDDLVSVDPWPPRMLEIRGRAEVMPSGGTDLGLGFGESLIRLYPEKVNSFGIG